MSAEREGGAYKKAHVIIEISWAAEEAAATETAAGYGATAYGK